MWGSLSSYLVELLFEFFELKTRFWRKFNLECTCMYVDEFCSYNLYVEEWE